MNPSTWVSHNSLRIYGTSSSELVSAHTSQATEFVPAQVLLQRQLNQPNFSFYFHFVQRAYNLYLVCFLFFFLTLPACPLAVKRLPLSINVSCDVTNPGFTVSFMDFMSVLKAGGKKSLMGSLWISATCQTFIIAIWLWHDPPQSSPTGREFCVKRIPSRPLLPPATLSSTGLGNRETGSYITTSTRDIFLSLYLYPIFSHAATHFHKRAPEKEIFILDATATT